MKASAPLVSIPLFSFMCACAAGVSAAEPAPRPKDAAEAVQEGNVRNWVEYYERIRRENPPPKPAQPAPASDPHVPPPPRRQ